jgi:hypothetical protein
MSDTGQSAPASAQKTAAWDFLAQHFAMVSALALFAAVIAAVVFLSGYLSVFDWRLIWIIEYPDILKFALVVIGLLSSFLYLLQSAVLHFFAKEETEGKSFRRFLKVVGFLAAMVGLGSLAGWLAQGQAHLLAHVSVFMALVFVVLFVDMTRDTVSKWERVSPASIGNNIVVGLIAMYFSGAALGAWTKEGSAGTQRQDVTLKSGELKNVIIVMMTTHHTVFYVDDQVVMVLTADVLKVISKPKK